VIIETPGSIAEARREHVAMMQQQRKIRIAHYGRTKSAKYEGKVAPLDSLSGQEEKRCTFITPNSGMVTYL
jgi:DNA-3-methyladenine glycosylase I